MNNKTKTRSLGLKSRTTLIASGMLAMASVANASVMLTSYTETATSFRAVYAFTQDISPLSVQTSGLGSWSATLTQTYSPAIPLLSPASYSFSWEAAHLAPIGIPGLGDCSIAAGTLTGAFCQQTVNNPHVLGGYDQFSFILELANGGGYATLTGTHLSQVPVPAAAWLLLSGFGGLAAVARRKSTRA